MKRACHSISKNTNIYCIKSFNDSYKNNHDMIDITKDYIYLAFRAFVLFMSSSFSFF